MTRYRFTKEDCQRGYQAALKKCMTSWALLAWFTYRVRGFYRKKEKVSHGEKEGRKRNGGGSSAATVRERKRQSAV